MSGVVVHIFTVGFGHIDRGQPRLTEAFFEDGSGRRGRDGGIDACDRVPCRADQRGRSRRVGARTPVVRERSISVRILGRTSRLPTIRHGRDVRIDTRETLSGDTIGASFLGGMWDIHASIGEIVIIGVVDSREVWVVGNRTILIEMFYHVVSFTQKQMVRERQKQRNVRK